MLPAPNPAPRPSSASSQPHPPIKDFAARVLLVDDEPDLLESMKAVLEANNFACRTAEDGFEALRQLRETPPDIIVTDLRMPNMSGFELLAILGRRFPHIPVIVISGEFIVHTDNPGMLMNAFFRKGEYTPPQLISTLRDLYSQRPLRPALARQGRAPLWINRRSSDYLLATCTDCLRSFPIENHNPIGEALQATECPSCGTTITYAVDSSVLRILELQQAAARQESVLAHNSSSASLSDPTAATSE
jgi:CheY-like chemotaxis protein